MTMSCGCCIDEDGIALAICAEHMPAASRFEYRARQLLDAELDDVAADAYLPIAHPACAPLERKTIEHFRAGLIASGRATAAEIDQHLGNLDAGRLDLAIGPMISAWGRKPA